MMLSNHKAISFLKGFTIVNNSFLGEELCCDFIDNDDRYVSLGCGAYADDEGDGFTGDINYWFTGNGHGSQRIMEEEEFAFHLFEP